MPKHLSSLGSGLTGTVAGVLVGGVVVGGGALAAVAANGDGAASTPASSSAPSRLVDVPCGALRSRLPESLREDLAGLRELEPGERAAEARKIRRAARAGEYGERVEQFAERRFAHRGEIWKRLPADLRADLREVKQADPEDRRVLLEQLRDSALSGDYGDRVQELAERAAERRAECGTGPGAGTAG